MQLDIFVRSAEDVYDMLGMIVAPALHELSITCKQDGPSWNDGHDEEIQRFLFASGTQIHRLLLYGNYEIDVTEFLTGLPKLTRLEISPAYFNDGLLRSLTTSQGAEEVSAPKLEEISVGKPLPPYRLPQHLTDTPLLDMVRSRTAHADGGSINSENRRIRTETSKLLELKFKPTLDCNTLLELGFLRSQGLQVIMDSS
jgi:hypothetical protein